MWAVEWPFSILEPGGWAACPAGPPHVDPVGAGLGPRAASRPGWSRDRCGRLCPGARRYGRCRGAGPAPRTRTPATTTASRAKVQLDLGRRGPHLRAAVRDTLPVGGLDRRVD